MNKLELLLKASAIKSAADMFSFRTKHVTDEEVIKRAWEEMCNEIKKSIELDCSQA